MKPLFFSFAALGLILASPTLADGDPSWSAPHEPYHIVDNVWYVGTAGIGVYLITTDEGHFLIDGATKDGAAIVEDNIKTLGFDIKDVKYIVETHAHYDHVGGLARLKADSGAELVASVADRTALEAGQHEGDNIYGASTFPAVKVDRIVGEGGTITLADSTLMARLTPGHTKGATTWTLTALDNGQPRRVVFASSVSVAGNVLVDNATYPHIVRDYRIAFDRLETISADIFLSSHPTFASLEDKYQKQKTIKYPEDKAQPFVDSTEFPKYVAQARADFETELARQENAKK
ncbi:metallo-beta-lactamase L1 [Asticcacaulis biprosthecium C19]|uniref:Metallo-beta-lactamase L1 n=1 Tax=Asticcacaulis biprosthecium C19 TaxID=715226 RepID=F4QHQ6_9CAUL|nr:subclass B3 metallo-beta-lactamase [Asticcacaulis biprosthecium]EGF92793.1 metallo-beta-lactamase L1 [Asticcacaulis biprosthecium C19]